MRRFGRNSHALRSPARSRLEVTTSVPRARSKEREMRLRTTVASTATVLAALFSAGWGAAPAPAATTCTWGGTPLAPTGTFKQSTGATNTPSTEPVPFTATGPLAGGCSGTLTYRGSVAAGATCAFGPFEAKATGLPGVVRAAGDNIAGLVPALLYDK